MGKASREKWDRRAATARLKQARDGNDAAAAYMANCKKQDKLVLADQRMNRTR